MSLRRDEAVRRAALLAVDHYDVDLDLARDEEVFGSRTRIRFTAREAGETFLDVRPVRLERIALDGAPLSPDLLAEGRFPLHLSPGEHLLEVDAVMGFRTDGEGLHRSVDAADGRTYCYAMSFMSAAPSIFACFDQPDLKASYSLGVTAPPAWTVLGNGAAEQVEPGCWRLARTEPLSTYFVTLVAGDYVSLHEEHDGIPLGLHARQSLAAFLDRDAEELFTVTRQCFDAFHALFGIRYPFGKYDQAFVPEFNAGAMENPGCVTFRDPLLPPGRVPRSESAFRANIVAHEMAHQWFGNLTTPVWWDDLWLNEAFAEYLGNRVSADHTEFAEARALTMLGRKVWGLTADSRPSTHPVAGNGAEDAAAALQDFDGISYAKGSALLGQLAGRIGDAAFFGGVVDHFERHRFGNATMADLFGSWERAGAGPLADWTSAWLRTAGVDRLELDRAAGEIVRTGSGPDRSHALGVAHWSGDGWTVGDLLTEGARTPCAVGEQPVLLDAHGTAWADLAFDDVTAAALPELLPQTTDPTLRAAVWTTLRNAVHQARIRPSAAVDIACAGIAGEDLDAALSEIGVWVAHDGEGGRGGAVAKLLPVVAAREPARERLHGAFGRRLQTAEPGSSVQLAAFHGAVLTSPSAEHLRRVLDGDVPDGIDVDDRLRWRALRRLTALGRADRDLLDRERAASESDQAHLGHLWCRARLADPEAKEWAWRYFTGEEAGSNYDIEAVGCGFWDLDQADLLSPYVARYFAELPATVDVRAGWLLGSAAQVFYPVTALSEETAALAAGLLADPDLDPTVRRVVVDCDDEVRRRRTARALDGV